MPPVDGVAYKRINIYRDGAAGETKKASCVLCINPTVRGGFIEWIGFFNTAAEIIIRECGLHAHIERGVGVAAIGGVARELLAAYTKLTA